MHVVRRDEREFRALPGRGSADPLAGVDVGALSVRYARLRPGPRNAHRHPGCAEVIHVLEGDGSVWLDGAITPVHPGDLYVIPAGVPHATLPDPGNEMLLLCSFPVADVAANTVELPQRIEL